MQYILSFLEGIITFVSPCMLPMLPIYISYFAGNVNGNEVNAASNKQKPVIGALGFVLGFTLVFITLGAFAGTVGSFLTRHQTAFNIISGAIIILFGLNFMGALNIPLLNKTKKISLKNIKNGFLPSILFGIIFAIGWSPCVGVFLASALLLAAQSGTVLQGILMLLAFSLGLGLPFILSAVLIDNLKGMFNFFKRNYKIINLVSGIFLIVVGIFMASGLFGYLLRFLTF